MSEWFARLKKWYCSADPPSFTFGTNHWAIRQHRISQMNQRREVPRLITKEDFYKAIRSLDGKRARNLSEGVDQMSKGDTIVSQKNTSESDVDGFCNYCRVVTDSKENDCVDCGFSKPTGMMMQRQIDNLLDKLRRVEEQNQRLREKSYLTEVKSLRKQNEIMRMALQEITELTGMEVGYKRQPKFIAEEALKVV